MSANPLSDIHNEWSATVAAADVQKAESASAAHNVNQTNEITPVERDLPKAWTSWIFRAERLKPNRS